MAIKPPVTMPKTDRELFAWLREAYDLRLRFGTGSPQNVVTARPGTLYVDELGGSATLWVKQTGTGSTGWVSK